MIKIENTETYGWEAAIRGMRNPKNSWDKSDSLFTSTAYVSFYEEEGPVEYSDLNLGERDLALAKTLSNAGMDHGKFLRFITVSCDITAPLYWWKEFDTYKVGTVRDSCSTMHKIHAKEFAPDDFSKEHLTTESLGGLETIITLLNISRRRFLEDGEKSDWWQMIQLLPSSYNQKATVQVNYAVLKNMYHARKNHKLDEWHTFCDWIEDLPYARELIIGE